MSHRSWTLGVLALQLAVAAVNAASAVEILSQVPSCASECIGSTFITSACDPEDVTACICLDIAVQSELSTSAATVEGALCEGYPKASRRTEVRRTLIISCSLVLFIVTLRLFTSKQYAGGLWRDDYMTILAAALLIALAAVYLHITSIGFGMHYWTIPVGNGVVIRKMLYVGTLIYTVLQAAVKLSIVLFLGRIFPSETFRRIAQGLQVILLLHGTLFIVPFATQCVPVQSIWDRTITDRRCLNLQAVGYSSGGLAMAEDIAILLLPIPYVWRLKISLRRRLAVIALFSIGSFACVTSAVRVRYLVEYSTTFDETWDHVDIVAWSFIEQSTAMLCASLPSLRLLLVSVWPRRRSTASESFFSKDSPKHRWTRSVDRLRRHKTQIRRDSGPGPQHTGDGVLVTTTVEVDRQSYVALDVPPFPPPAYSGRGNNT
ncbi:integral membrane protein [Colletotrichum abscissum]|uniref:Integral membrane protein n=1 Tax=Colletotrichum abscissum TaxID=1671311 RepID=A0A9P9XD57_9PEZI|nr:integral membrane protein [Colletotrichum abscissum]